MLVLLYTAGCPKPDSGTGGTNGSAGLPAHSAPEPNAAADREFAAIRPRIEAFCGGCHGVPAPDTFPRDAWYDEVEQGYGFYYSSGRSDLDPPKLQDVVAYYRKLAPAELRLPPPTPASSTQPVHFRREIVAAPEQAQSGVSQLRWWTPEGAAPALLVADMRAGLVAQVTVTDQPAGVQSWVEVPHPAHIEPTDLDGDGRPDFVIADLGSQEPADHNLGQVLWLHQPIADGEWQLAVLAEGLGRVADVQPADVDSDGDLDLIVAEFGWRTTGRILLLEQTGTDTNGLPAFEIRPLDDRHGTIHVPVADLNGDSHPDFVALISQEHEIVEAFLGRGDGTFDKRTIHAAGDPSYGSSGIELVDIDGDGDLDVLYTNGDTLDSQHLKPYHAVQWLENRGEFPFTRRELLRLPGAMRARTADLDGDEDLDVVACAFFAHRRTAARDGGGPEPLTTLVWLEQAAPGEFRPHVLDIANAGGHMTLEVGDFNGDGRLDIAAGHFSGPGQQVDTWISLWWNDGPAARETRSNAEGRR
jgi:hypothetical protein